MTQPCVDCGFQFNCICSLLPKLQSEHAFLLLKHPNEVKRDTNTGTLIGRCGLPVTEFIWDRKSPPAELLQTLSDPNVFPVVLFPSPNSLTLMQVEETSALEGRRPLYVILDATWQEARKMINKSRWLSGMAMLELTIDMPSQYSLRRNQQEGHLCTFEIAAQLLGQLGLLKYS